MSNSSVYPRPAARRTKPAYRQPEPSPIEIAFWDAGKPVIPELEREVWIDQYRVDFLIPSRKVVIELYGYAWHNSKEKITQDKQRERYLQQQGYHVIGFTGSEVYKDPHACVLETLKCVHGLTGSGLFSAPPTIEARQPQPAAPRRQSPPAPRARRAPLGLSPRQWQAALLVGGFDLAVIVLGLLVVSA